MVDQNGGLHLSSLDVISCGFGAAVLLGMVFMVVRDQSSVEASAPPFIVVTCRSTPDPRYPKVVPLVNLRVKLPTGPEFDLPLDDFDSRTGRPKPRGQRRRPTLPIDNMRIFGFSRTGNHRIRRIREDGEPATPAPAGGPAVYRLKIDRPAEGAWSVRARFLGTANGEDLSDEEFGRGHKAVVAVEIVTRSQASRFSDSVGVGRLGQSKSFGVGGNP